MTASRASRRGSVTLLLVSLLLLAAAAGVIGWRASEQPRAPQLPPLRETPLAVVPRYDNPRVITDEQLARVLGRLRPRLNGKTTRIGGIDHALRFWTAAARFDDAAYVSGEELRALLTDHGRFAALYGPDERPLLMREGRGVRVRTQDGIATSTHVDHTLACLAEVGTPLSFPLHLADGPATFRDMLEQSLRDFSLNQVEYEWSALTYALFLPPGATGWTTREGQHVTFDMLADRAMRERIPRGVCFGNHRLYTLAALLQIDEEHPILSPAARARVLAFLQAQTAILIKNQSAEGYWGADWAREEGQPEVETDRTGDTVSDRILATGHALEWWAIAPESCLPEREVIIRASQWLVKTIDDSTDEQIQSRFTYLSHAGRALALWRKADPAEVVRQ
jgi:hypothetical protein